MKKKYETPQVEKIEFDYSETIVASEGQAYQRYTHDGEGCNEHATGEWYVGLVAGQQGCKLKTT